MTAMAACRCRQKHMTFEDLEAVLDLPRSFFRGAQHCSELAANPVMTRPEKMDT